MTPDLIARVEASTELLPCPFWGHPFARIDHSNNCESRVVCGECGASTGWASTPAGAIAAWNTRTPESASE